MMKTEYERFIAEVRKQMAVQDITQVEAAKRIRADRGNLNQQISGRHKGMRAQTMFDLAKRYVCRVTLSRPHFLLQSAPALQMPLYCGFTFLRCH